MILNIPERITLFGILPEQGNFVTLKIVQNLRTELLFSEEEIKEADMKMSDDGRQITWVNMLEKDVTIGEKATDVIVDALKKIDEKKELLPQHMPLWEKFIGGE